MRDYFMSDETIELSSYLGELEKSLEALSLEQLKTNVMAYAKDLEPLARFEFMQMIALDDSSFDEREAVEYIRDMELAEDVNIFYGNLLKGAYDHSLDINNPDDVPLWVDDMDVLFDRTHEAFVNRDWALAAESYEVLLDALHIAENIAVEHQLYSAQDIVITDITEAKACYFRSLYESSEAGGRPEKIFEAMKRNYALGNARCGTEDMREAFVQQMNGFDLFVAEWIELLKQEAAREDGFEKRITLWLLREAVFASSSFEGLDALAEEQGDAHPEIYYDLVAYHVKAGELDKAETMARQGIDRIQLPHQRAVLADWLAELADKDKDFALARKSRKEAWRYEPTQERLVNWFHSLGGTLSDDELAEEINFLRNCPQSANYVRLICMLELLVGEYELPLKALITAGSFGWRQERHPAREVLPFLLLAGSGIREIGEGTSLKFVTEEMKSVFIRWQAHMIDGKTSAPLYTYLDYLFDGMDKHPILEEQYDHYLASARTVILDRMRAVVGEGLEHLYPVLAHFVVAYAEVCFLSDQKERGMSFINSIRNMYIRQAGLRREIRALFNSSPVLPNMNFQGQLED
jgi:hypothetical protein